MNKPCGSPLDAAVHFDPAMLDIAKRRAVELRAAAIDEALSRAADWPAVLLGALRRAISRAQRRRVATNETAACRS